MITMNFDESLIYIHKALYENYEECYDNNCDKCLKDKCGIFDERDSLNKELDMVK